MPLRFILGLLVLFSLGLSAPLSAQDLLWRVEGVGGLVGRGRDLHRIGDFNHDGWEDLLERGPVWNGQYIEDAIRIVSGADGSILSSAAITPRGWTFGNFAPLGDMDQDGVPDYGAQYYDSSSPSTTQSLAVFSGATRALLWSATIPNAWTTNFGAVLCGELDVNGDGRNDVVTSAIGLSPGGTIIVYDNSGVELYRIVDPVPNLSAVGLDVASLHGDLDGDGCGDFVATALDPQGRGAVVCFSGRTGAVLRVSFGEQPGDALVNAGSCGDIDRDGVPDYCGGGSFQAGVVTAFSGATGQIIHSWRDPLNCCMGINVIGGYDLDQDGVPDLAAGTISTSPGIQSRIMNALSGRDGTFLARWYRTANFSTCGGETVAMLAPPPGEQYPVIVFSERCWQSTTNNCTANAVCPGVVFAYRGCPKGVRAYGMADASPGEPHARSGMRSPTAAAIPSVRFTMSETPPGAAALFMLGASNIRILGAALPVGLAPFGLPGITLWQSADVRLFTMAGTSGADAGYAALDVPLPSGRVIDTSGTPLYAQWLWFDTTNLARHGSTAGQRFRLQ